MKTTRMMKTTNNLLFVGGVFAFGVCSIFVLSGVLLARPDSEIPRFTEGEVAGETSFGELPEIFHVRHLQKTQNYYPFNPDGVSAESIVVTDYKTGDVLFEKNSNTPHALASLSKLLTSVYLFDRGFDATASGTVSPESIAELIRAYDIPLGVNAAVSDLDLDAQEMFDAHALLQATLIASANDAAGALVASQGLSPSEFISGVNDYFASLGLRATTLLDPTGLHPGNMSTAREFVYLATRAFTYEDIRRLSTSSGASITSLSTGNTYALTTTNRLLDTRAQDLLGGKTGYLDEAKYTYVTAFRHASGRELLIVVLGAQSAQARFHEASELMDWLNVAYK